MKNTGLKRQGLINTCNTGKQCTGIKSGKGQREEVKTKDDTQRQNYEIKQEITEPKTQTMTITYSVF